MSDKLMRDDTGQAIATLLREFLNTQNSTLADAIGKLANLTTTAKENLVAAINELVSKRGDLSGLSTNAKTTLVAAINELVGINASGRLSTLETIAATLGTGGFPANYAAHNAIFRGRNLGSAPTAEQWQAISSEKFTDLFIGDYWDNGTFRIIIAHFTYFWRVRDWWTGSPSRDQYGGTPHVVCIIMNSGGVSGYYKSPWKEDGDISGGYMASDIRALCRGQVTDDMKAFFGAEHLMYHYDTFTNAINPDTGATTGSIAVEDSCVEVPSWRQKTRHLSNFGLINDGHNSYIRGPFALYNLRGIWAYYSHSSDWSRDLGSATEAWRAMINSWWPTKVTNTNYIIPYLSIKG